MVSSEISLNVLDLTLLLVDGFIQTDIYSKPTDHHIYLLRNSAHPSHCTRAIPFGVATRVCRNCSTIEKFEEGSKEYQNYLIDCGYHPSKVKTQFDKAKDTPREDLLSSKEREKKVIFPLVVNFNPHLANIGKIIKLYSHFIYDSPTLAQIFPKGSIIPSYRRAKTIKELLAGPKGSNYSNNGNCEEELPKKPVGRLSADCWPTVGRQLGNSRPTVGRQLTDCCPTVGRQLTDCCPTVGRQLTDCCPTVGRQFVLCLRPKCWLTVGDLLATCR